MLIRYWKNQYEYIYKYYKLREEKNYEMKMSAKNYT